MSQAWYHPLLYSQGLCDWRKEQLIIIFVPGLYNMFRDLLERFLLGFLDYHCNRYDEEYND